VDNSVEDSGPPTVVTMEAAQRTWTDPDGDTVFDLIGELNLRHQHVTATRPGGAYLRVRISDDLRRYLVDHNADEPGVVYRAVVGREADEFAAQADVARVMARWVAGHDGWREILRWRELPRPAKDYAAYRADLADHAGFVLDQEQVDGVRLNLFGVEDRNGNDVLRGSHAEPDGSSPLVIDLTERVDGLPLSRAAQLVISVYLHHFLNHHYCDRVSTVTIRDLDSVTYTAALDSCE
jgi:hypothetical protein